MRKYKVYNGEDVPIPGTYNMLEDLKKISSKTGTHNLWGCKVISSKLYLKLQTVWVSISMVLAWTSYQYRPSGIFDGTELGYYSYSPLCIHNIYGFQTSLAWYKMLYITKVWILTDFKLYGFRSFSCLWHLKSLKFIVIWNSILFPKHDRLCCCWLWSVSATYSLCGTLTESVERLKGTLLTRFMIIRFVFHVLTNYLY